MLLTHSKGGRSVAARDSCALVRCPRCGTIIEISGESAAALKPDAEWLGPVVAALCGCWVRGLPDEKILHLWILLAA